MRALLFNTGPEVAEDPGHEADIGKVRDPFKDTGFARQESGGKDREGGILGTAGGDCSLERDSAFNSEYVHIGRLFGLS